FLLGRLPHVALLTLPRTGVLGGVGAQSPALADLVRDFPGNQVGRPPVHRGVAGGVDDEVGGQLGAVRQANGVFGQVVDLPRDELHIAVAHQVGRADVDVVARAAAQVLHEQPGAVVAPVVVEA